MERVLYLKNHKNKSISCIIHEPGNYNNKFVIMCHGFSGTKIGPHRMFVDLARKLCNANYKVLRFDFPCNGDSEGEFIDNNFDDWSDTILSLSKEFNYKKLGILGNSMGGTCVIHTLGKRQLADIFVTWVADPKFKRIPKTKEQLLSEKSGFSEERGTIVKWEFWEKIIEKDFLKALKIITISGLMIFAGKDHFITSEDIKKIGKNIPKNVQIKIYQNADHAFYDVKTTVDVIRTTFEFFNKNL